MSRLGEIREREGKASPGPWKGCGKNKCVCRQVWSEPADHPVAIIESGKWGDDYPSIRLVGPSLNIHAEAYMEQITYGEIGTETAEANVAFIAHSRQDIPFLLGIIDRLAVLAKAVVSHGEAFPEDEIGYLVDLAQSALNELER
jgi:hypothetical protein